MAAAVYCVWQEHNNRIFVNRYCTVDGVVRNIEEFVRAKMWNWQKPRTYMNWLCVENGGQLMMGFWCDWELASDCIYIQ